MISLATTPADRNFFTIKVSTALVTGAISFAIALGISAGTGTTWDAPSPVAGTTWDATSTTHILAAGSGTTWDAAPTGDNGTTWDTPPASTDGTTWDSASALAATVPASTTGTTWD
ncbi:hypothetical protein GCM10009677_64190 [Sphaerisporangium rubeum]|uniref:Uncharacterized protein n=1 Tax=Sphaerisporangium rubeum TaxID=321317 RepID=A0A7X0IEC0_9ACTN|nr:hypothetical protein [Sphaerisporangium rubeum]MBB6472393.1 hypothetical protein [Sphaerisporangium rubeum]